MNTIVDEKRIRELVSKPQSELNDSTKNNWRRVAEIVGSFCVSAFIILLCSFFYNRATSTFDIIVFALFFILLSVEIFCIIKSLRFNKEIHSKIFDQSSDFTYSILKGMFVEKVPHSSSVGDSIYTTYTYDFKIESKEYTFSEIKLFGSQRPTQMFTIIKIVFTFQNGDKAVRIYGFNQNEFEIQLPEEKETADAFCFDNRFGLITFVS